MNEHYDVVVLAVAADNFICANPHFCKSALSRYTQWDFIALVERHGIDYEERNTASYSACTPPGTFWTCS